MEVEKLFSFFALGINPGLQFNTALEFYLCLSL